jgi:hypothetical protein
MVFGKEANGNGNGVYETGQPRWKAVEVKVPPAMPVGVGGLGGAAAREEGVEMRDD